MAEPSPVASEFGSSNRGLAAADAFAYDDALHEMNGPLSTSGNGAASLEYTRNSGLATRAEGRAIGTYAHAGTSLLREWAGSTTVATLAYGILDPRVKNILEAL